MRLVSAILLVCGWLAAGVFGGVATTQPGGTAKVTVQPFAVVSADARHRWMGAAVQQSLIAELARVPTLEPMSQASARAFVIRGTVQVVEENVRLTGQVVDGSGSVLGQFKATGPANSLLELQDSVAEQAGRFLPRPVQGAMSAELQEAVQQARQPSGPRAAAETDETPSIEKTLAVTPRIYGNYSASSQQYYFGLPVGYYCGYGYGYGYWCGGCFNWGYRGYGVYSGPYFIDP